MPDALLVCLSVAFPWLCCIAAMLGSTAYEAAVARVRSGKQRPAGEGGSK